MTSLDLVKLAGLAAPELMKKTAMIAQLTERIDPDSARALFADLDEIISHAGEKAKTAGALSEWAKRTSIGAGTAVAGTVGAGLGIALATDMYNAARRGLTSGRNWKRMIEANPELKEKHKLEEVRKHFNSLHRAAPDVAADPLAAGAAVHNLIQASGLEGQYARSLTDIAKMQKDRVEARYAPFGNAPGKVQVQNNFGPKTTGDSKQRP